MRQLFKDELSDFEFLGDVRGRGLFIGLEFVGDRDKQTPLKGGTDFVSKLKRRALENNMLIYPGNGTVDGKQGNHILFAPPFVSTSDDIHEMVIRIKTVLHSSFADFKHWKQ